MRRWTRATQDTWCGFCSGIVHPGDPLLLIELPHVSRVQRRCRQCAGEPVNVDHLEAEDVRRDRAATPIRPTAGFTALGTLARDWKRAAGGDS